MKNIILVVGALVLLGLAIAADYFFRQRKKKAADPSANFDTAWDRYLADPGNGSQRDRRAVESLRAEGQAKLERLRESCAAAVERALGSSNPQAALREAVMDATDRFVLGESMRKTPDEGGDREAIVESGVLRRFAMLRFGDYDHDDWYTHYLKVAEMNSKNVAAMVRKTISGDQASVESALHDPLTRTMQETREALLHYPPRTPVKRATKLSVGEAPVKLAPSQQQVDRLIQIMNQRFEKLFSGQVYQLDRGPLVDPAGAFQIDAALLHTLLAVHFRQPADAWRQIMSNALGRFGDAMQNEDRLLQMAGEFRQIWIERRQEGPLHEVLRRGCRMAFDPEGSGAPDTEALATGMMEDAGLLVGAVREVVEPG